MQFMKKKLLALGMATVLGLSFLAGCSSNTSPSSNAASSKENPEKEQKVLVWTNNRHDAEYMQQVVENFNTEHAGKIKVEFVINTDNYINMITMGITSDQSPDIFCVGAATTGFDLKSFVDSKILCPLNDLITDEFKETYNVEKLNYPNINTIGENIYYIPTAQRSGMRIIYNKELMEKAGITEMPKTFGDVAAYAKKISDMGKGVKYGIGMPGQSAPLNRMIIPAAEVSGILPYNYTTGKFDFSGYAPLIEISRKMFKDGSMIPGAASMKVDPLRVQFSEGNIGMYGNASQEVGVLKDQFPAKMEWGIAEIPSLTGEINGALSAMPQNGWAMTSTAKNQKAAWEVIEYLSSADVMKNYVEKGYALSTSDKVMTTVDKSKIGKLSEFDLLDYESVYPKFPTVVPEGKSWEDAIWEACCSNTGDINQILASLTKTYNEALDREVKMGKVQRLVIKDFNAKNPTQGTYEFLSK